MPGKPIPKDQLEFIRLNVVGLRFNVLAEMFNEKFNTSYNSKQLRSIANSHGFHNGLKGYDIHRKGKKLRLDPKKTHGFIKGHIPNNKKELGGEYVDKNGYVLLKVSDDDSVCHHRWRPKHIVLWEAENGPVPDGSVVVFLDGDKGNFNINNLILASRAECGLMNLNNLRSPSADLTQAGVAVAKLLIKTNERARKARYEKLGGSAKPIHRYTPEQVEWVIDNIQEQTYADLAKAFNKHFGVDITKSSIRHMAYRWGIKKH
jgi:hypothetical protein